MWICQHCRAEVESDDWDTCWNCQWSRTGEPPAERVQPALPQPLGCLRCQTPLQFAGTKRFDESAPLARLLFDNLGELFVHSNEFDLFICPRCGHVEFFLTEVGAELRQRGDASIP